MEVTVQSKTFQQSSVAFLMPLFTWHLGYVANTPFGKITLSKELPLTKNKINIKVQLTFAM